MRTTIYLQGDKDSNWETAEQLGLSEEAQRMFSYALLEFGFEIEVNDDGTFEIIRAFDKKNELVPKKKKRLTAPSGQR